MNINYENDDLRPYEEPSSDFNDTYRIGLSNELHEFSAGPKFRAPCQIFILVYFCYRIDNT
jgi:hypothetical protein